MARHTDDHATRRRRRCALVIVAAWTLALSGCHAATQLRPDATPSVPATATPALDTPALDKPALHKPAMGSRRFRDCTAAARDEPARRRCLDEELVYQQHTLDRLADERAAALDAAGRRDFQAAQRAWQQETDRVCGIGAGATAPDHAAARCRIDRISARFDRLSLDASGAPPGVWVKATPSASGAVDARVRDAALSLQSDGCADERGRVVCRNARLRIVTSTMREQSLTVPMLVFTPAGQPGGTLYRGRLDKGFADGWHSVVLTDIDADGDEDLLVWAGFDGNYGDPSYRYYLYDAGSGRLEESAALAGLVQGHSIARIADGQVFVWSRSGPCERGEKTIDLRGPAPTVAASRTYDACRQDAP